MGLSLIESVAGLAILGGALVSAGGLLAAGARQIGGAGRLSAALSVAHGAVASTAGPSLERVLDRLGCDPARADCEVESSAEDWGVPARPRLGPTRVRLRLDALDAESLARASTIRITSSVSWHEGRRERRVRLVSVRG